MGLDVRKVTPRGGGLSPRRHVPGRASTGREQGPVAHLKILLTIMPLVRRVGGPVITDGHFGLIGSQSVSREGYSVGLPIGGFGG